MHTTFTDRVLWAIVAAFALFGVLKATPLGAAMGALVPLATILIPLLFATIHGAPRLGWKTMLVFFAITFAVSWGYESLSIATGFPFGNYHYSDRLGLKLGQVPLLIMPAYFAVCYLCWHLAHIVVDKFDRRPDRLQLFAVPVLASFIMVMWDMSMDPARSTLNGAWIWHDGGAYFGVPFENFMGWFLCVYTVFQFFALYLRIAGTATSPAAIEDGQRVSWHLVTAMYGAMFVEFIVAAYVAGDATVVDASSQAWSTRDMLQSLGLVSIFTMFFVTCLSFVKVQASSLLK